MRKLCGNLDIDPAEWFIQDARPAHRLEAVNLEINLLGICHFSVDKMLLANLFKRVSREGKHLVG